MLQEHYVRRDNVRGPRHGKKDIELPSDSGITSSDASQFLSESVPAISVDSGTNLWYQITKILFGNSLTQDKST